MSLTTPRAVGEHVPAVVIIDDHELLGDTVAFALARQGVHATALPVTTEAELLAQVEALRPDAVLLDLFLGDFGSALVLVEPIRALGSAVVIMTGETSRAAWGECIEAGACAVVSKTAPFDDILETVTRAAQGEPVLDAAARERLLDALRAQRSEERIRMEPFQRLSVRECEVLEQLVDGNAAEAIAGAGFVSVTTVRSHIRSILQKLGVNSQLAAVAMATRSGWRSPHPQRQARNPQS